ncbi:MAG: hypothetical protein JWP63_4605, partial [Candidatus Solibacter sp.]|nr:hypothetical protein [Candidatus Solibacter sp.]
HTVGAGAIGHFRAPRHPPRAVTNETLQALARRPKFRAVELHAVSGNPRRAVTHETL